MSKALKYEPGVEKMMTIRGVAACTGLTVDRVKTLVERGELPAWVVSGQYQIKPSDVRAYLKRALVEVEA